MPTSPLPEAKQGSLKDASSTASTPSRGQATLVNYTEDLQQLGQLSSRMVDRIKQLEFERDQAHREKNDAFLLLGDRNGVARPDVERREKERKRCLPAGLLINCSPSVIEAMLEMVDPVCYTDGKGGMTVQLKRPSDPENATRLSQKIRSLIVPAKEKDDVGLVLVGPHVGAQVKVKALDFTTDGGRDEPLWIVTPCKGHKVEVEGTDGPHVDEWKHNTMQILHKHKLAVGKLADAGEN